MMLKPEPEHLLYTRFDEWALYTDDHNIVETLQEMPGIKYIVKRWNTEYRIGIDPRFKKEEVAEFILRLFPSMEESNIL